MKIESSGDGQARLCEDEIVVSICEMECKVYPSWKVLCNKV